MLIPKNLTKSRLKITRMPFIMRRMEERITTIVVLLLTGIAMWSDLRTKKVPNRLILAGYLTGAILLINAPPDRLDGLPDIVVRFVWRAAWPILLLYPLFLLRGLGAGDIKLFSVLSVFYPCSILTQIMVYSLFIGAGISICHILVCRITRTKRRKYIHYTVCIFFAGIIQIWKGRYL